MNRTTQWLSLIAGLVIFGYGVMKLIGDQDWVLLILGILIIAFSASKILKSRARDRSEPSSRG